MLQCLAAILHPSKSCGQQLAIAHDFGRTAFAAPEKAQLAFEALAQAVQQQGC